MEQLRPPARLRDDADALRARLPAEVAEPDRRAWLDVQLVALETQAAALAGDAMPYLEHVARCFAYPPAAPPGRRCSRRPRPRIDALLPGDAPLADRLAAWDARFEIPVERLPASSTGSSTASGPRPRRCSGCPMGEDLRVSLVTGSHGAPTTGSTAAGGRGSTSTRTCRSAPTT